MNKVLPVRRAQQGQWVPLVQPAHKANKVLRAKSVRLVQWDRLGLRVNKGRKVKLVPWVLLAHRAPPAFPAGT